MPFADIDMLDGKMAIRVATAWNEKDLIQAIPGSRYIRMSWWLPLTWPACLQLRGTFGANLHLGGTLVLWAKQHRSEYVDPALRIRSLYALDEPQSSDDHLFPFQRIAVDFMNYAGSGLLGDDMGCGKTIEVLSYLSTLDNPYPAIIVCPNSVKIHWAVRMPDWLPEAEPFIVSGTAREKYDNIAEASLSEHAVLIVNYESMRMLSRLAPYGSVKLKRCKQCDPIKGDDIKPAACHVHPKPLNGFGFKTVILDEAHRIKSPESQQTRAVWQICHEGYVEHAWALTGTPIEKSIEDLWSIMHAVKPDEYPIKSKFISRYAITAWNAHGGTDTVGLHPQNADEFRAFFHPRYRRMIKDIVLPQLPSKVYTTRYVDMTATQARMYRELEDSLMCRTPEGKLLIASTALAARTRLAQLSCATCKITNMEDAQDPTSWNVELTEPSGKIDELVEIVKELGGQKAVVAAEHSKLIDLAEARLQSEGIRCLKITGDVSPYDRQRALEALKAGHIQILFFTTKAGGVGLDMSSASVLIWLQHPWSMIEYLQSVDRVRRIGSEIHSSIDIINIVTRGTIEEDKLERLGEKLERLDEITRDRKARLDAGIDDDYENDKMLLSLGMDLGR
jgi:SNF2 family DNA or RNA helicase